MCARVFYRKSTATRPPANGTLAPRTVTGSWADPTTRTSRWCTIRSRRGFSGRGRLSTFFEHTPYALVYMDVSNEGEGEGAGVSSFFVLSPDRRNKFLSRGTTITVFRWFRDIEKMSLHEMPCQEISCSGSEADRGKQSEILSEASGGNGEMELRGVGGESSTWKSPKCPKHLFFFFFFFFKEKKQQQQKWYQRTASSFGLDSFVTCHVSGSCREKEAAA